MAGMLAGISHAASRVRTGAEVVKDRAKEFADEHDVDVKTVDITVKFIGARGLPRMDLVGSADPYFVAKLDDRISYV